MAERELRQAVRQSLSPLMLVAMMLTVAAGMGEWKVLNDRLGGLPKAISLGVPCVAFLCFLIRADFAHMGRCLAYLPMFFIYIVALMVWTLAVWMLNLTEVSSIARGASKLLYQSFTILYAVGFVYLCRERSIDCFFYSMVMINSIIALLEIPSYGLAASVQSVITCVLSFGNAEGYVRALEIHDVTFLFGQFFVYYAALAPHANRRELRGNLLKAAVSMLFMLLGLKRAAIPAAMLLALYAWLVSRRKHPFRWILLTGLGLIAFFWLYLYTIRSGLFSEWMAKLGVDMMGRDYIWQLAQPYYRFSPAYVGRGFDAVDAIVSQWYRDGLMNHAYPFHNDILKVFVEMGFGGFCLWTAVQYIYYPCYWSRRHGNPAALVYFSLLAYMSITYLTDNTAFYYWSSTGLRLIPMAFSLMTQRMPEKKWWPPRSEDLATDVWRLQMEECTNDEGQTAPRA